jgi:hypothetical protein
MFYIKHNSDNFTIIDCCMNDEDEDGIVKEVQEQSAAAGVIRFISTHPDDDHIRGLVYLHEQMSLVNFYCVMNEATKIDESEDFNQYCALRDDLERAFYIYKGCSRKWMNLNSETRRTSGIRILWPDTGNKHYQAALAEAREGACPNNISCIVEYDVQNGTSFLWMGDLETNFMNKLDTIPVESAHILFAPHHGRDSGRVPADWLDRIEPRLIVIGEAPAEHLNYYDGYDTITQNSAGDITFECTPGITHIYVSNRYYSVDFLNDEQMPNTHGWYIGTLKI